MEKAMLEQIESHFAAEVNFCDADTGANVGAAVLALAKRGFVFTSHAGAEGWETVASGRVTGTIKLATDKGVDAIFDLVDSIVRPFGGEAPSAWFVTGIAAELSNLSQADERVQILGDDMSPEEIEEAYTARREALTALLLWDEYDNVAHAIRRLVEAQQAVQDAHDADAIGIDPDVDLVTALAERAAAIEYLQAASKSEQDEEADHV
jgi:hypothetical protein